MSEDFDHHRREFLSVAAMALSPKRLSTWTAFNLSHP
jgi:hypothetical protein